LLAFMVIFIPLILILPARIVDLLLPFYYGRVSDFITTILLVIMLAISMFLLWRYLQNMQLKITHKETETHELRNDPYRDTQPRWAHHS
jgi:ABC-type nickel/cobalt efflux system permease component RcnA